MRDGDIRRELDTLLRWQHADDPDTLIRHEMGLCAGERRIDLALLNGEIAGYEIKSDEDTLRRLAGQSHVYGRVLDRITLVTTRRHYESAIGLLPEWWGVIVGKQQQNCVTFETVRPSARNTELDSFSLAQLLWREEAMEELRARGLSKGLTRKARYYVWKTLSQEVSIGELRDLVRERVKARRDWSGGQLYV